MVMRLVPTADGGTQYEDDGTGDPGASVLQSFPSQYAALSPEQKAKADAVMYRNYWGSPQSQLEGQFGPYAAAAKQGLYEAARAGKITGGEPGGELMYIAGEAARRAHGLSANPYNTEAGLAGNRQEVRNDAPLKDSGSDGGELVMAALLAGVGGGMIAPWAAGGAGALGGTSGVTTGGVGGGSAWNNALGIGGGGSPVVTPWGAAGSGAGTGGAFGGTAGTGATNMDWFSGADAVTGGGSPVINGGSAWGADSPAWWQNTGVEVPTGGGSLANGYGAFGNAGSTGNAAWDFQLGGPPVGSGAPFAQNLGEAGSAASSWLDGLPSAAKSVAQAALKAVTGGSGTASAAEASSAMDILKKLGIPAAIAAGLMEKPKSPLQDELTAAAKGAVSSAGAFAGMPAVGMQPSTQKAIDLANSSVGAWKPYVDKAAGYSDEAGALARSSVGAWQPYLDKAASYTDRAAGGITGMDLSKYMNPYLDSVLAPALRDINEAADARREKLRAMTAMSGNDYVSTSGNRFNVSDSMLDRETLRAISDTSAKARAGAFDAATGLATTDLNRMSNAGGAFNTMANTVGTQRGADVSRLGAAGGAFNTLANTVGNQGGADFTRLGAAGEMEAKPAENALTKAADTAKLYASIIPGTTSAMTATKNPSILGQAVGAFGAYNAATKPGGILEDYRL